MFMVSIQETDQKYLEKQQIQLVQINVLDMKSGKFNISNMNLNSLVGKQYHYKKMY